MRRTEPAGGVCPVETALQRRGCARGGGGRVRRGSSRRSGVQEGHLCRVCFEKVSPDVL